MTYERISCSSGSDVYVCHRGAARDTFMVIILEMHWTSILVDGKAVKGGNPL